MSTTQTRVRLVRTPNGQTLDIPHGFELAGDEAVLRVDGHRLIVKTAKPRSLLTALNGLPNLDEAWPEIGDPLPEAVRF